METDDEILARVRRLIGAARARKGVKWEELFKNSDRDHSGFLDHKKLNELVRGTLNLSSRTLCDHDLSFMFNRVGKADSNSGGSIDLSDFLAYFSQAPRRPEDEAVRAHQRFERVTKNLRTSFQQLALKTNMKENENWMRDVIMLQDKEPRSRISLFAFKTFVRIDLKLTIWEVSNQDLDVYYKTVSKNNRYGITVGDLISNIQGAKIPLDLEACGLRPPSPGSPRARKKKTYREHLLENVNGSRSTPTLAPLSKVVRPSPSLIGLGRSSPPNNRIGLTKLASEFFTPEKCSLALDLRKETPAGPRVICSPRRGASET